MSKSKSDNTALIASQAALLAATHAATVGADIAVIKNQITTLSDSFKEFKEDNKALSIRLETVENTGIKTTERVSNLAIFQGVFSLIIGAIATFLGAK